MSLEAAVRLTAYPCVQVHIGHSQEVVCLGQSDTLMAAGSHSHTTLIDPRIEQPIKDIASLDSEHGELCHHAAGLSCEASGAGRLALQADGQAALGSWLSPTSDWHGLPACACTELCMKARHLADCRKCALWQPQTWHLLAATCSLQGSAPSDLTCGVWSGVRSVCFRDHLLSAGSGHGKISFYDLRADAYLQLDTPGSGKLPHHDGLTVGKGWLQEDSIYR